jgi:hypothetical protein
MRINFTPKFLAGLAFILLAAAACTLGIGLTPAPAFPSPLPITPGFPTSSCPTELPTPPQVITVVPSDTPPADTVPAPTEASTQAPISPTATTPRLTMGPGRTVVYADGSLATNSAATYLVGAKAGQFMMVMINSANQTLYLQIQAPNQSFLVSPGDKKNYWQGTLPMGGDYLVTVVAGGSGGNYDLSVTIPAQIVFKAGAVSASAQASVAAHGITTFLLRALQGQTMTVKVTSPSADVFLTIYGLQDGQPYVRSVTGSTSASIKLPSTQDYVIQCVSTGEAAEDISVDFTVK